MATPSHAGLQRWKLLLARASEPVVAFDARARILFVNRAWEGLTGYTAEEVRGKVARPGGSSEEILPGAIADSMAPPPEALAGRPASTRGLIVHRDGSRSWRTVEFLPFHGRDGKLLGLLGIFRMPDDPSIVPPAPSQEAREALLEIREHLRVHHANIPLVGRGPRHERLLQQVSAASKSRMPLVITGEPGTGKRHVARSIQALAGGADEPVIALDPGVLPAELIERELFGADSSRWSLPHDFTLILGDCASIPRDLQSRIVGALPQGKARLLVLTSIDPERALREQHWRDDFYFAVTGIVLRLAPIRERLDEVPLLAQHFLEEARSRVPGKHAGLAPGTLEILASYDWPGNLRELRRVIESAYEKSPGGLISPEDLPASIRGEFASSYAPPPLPASKIPLDPLLTQLERRLIEQALQRSRQNKSRAADLLEISRPRLYRRIKELNIPDLPEADEEAAT